MHISIVHGHHRMNRRLPSLSLSSRGLHFTKHQWWKLLLQKRNGFALRVEREILSRIRYQNMQRIISERWECSKVWSQCLLTKTNDFNTRNLHTLIHSYNYVYLRIYKVVQNLWYEHEFRDILRHEIRISRIIKSRGRLHELIKFENFTKDKNRQMITRIWIYSKTKHCTNFYSIFLFYFKWNIESFQSHLYY